MGFDLVKQDFNKSAEVGYSFDLKLPTGESSGAKLTVIGELSAPVQKLFRRRIAEYQTKLQYAKNKKREPDDPTYEELIENKVEDALTRLVGWEGVTENGKEVPFSKEKAKEILTAHTFILEQVMQESSDVTNFRPK